MKPLPSAIGLITVLLVFFISAAVMFVRKAPVDGPAFDQAILANTDRMIEEGRETFRHDTFGDEAFWTDALRLNEAIAGEDFGGVGPGLTPEAALMLGQPYCR